jgi:hypothetical protein
MEWEGARVKLKLAVFLVVGVLLVAAQAGATLTNVAVGAYCGRKVRQ